MGYKFYRDWGNETYADFLKNATKKAKEDKIIDDEDYAAIVKYSAANMGNILETIMGYSFISQYMKEEGLKEFTEIANLLENGLMQRMIEEDEEDHDDAEATA
eukprot:9102583-Heterocapsa_arctica.AAC.1